MDTRTRVRTISPIAVISLALLASGCSAGGSAQPEPADTSLPPSTSPSASAPSPSASGDAFAYPDETDPTQVGIYLKYEDGDVSGKIIAGPSILVADRAFSVEAQCEGDEMSFEVVTADADKRVLVEGDVDCDDPPAGEFTYELPYTGPVQVNILDADDVGRAWVRVVQP